MTSRKDSSVVTSIKAQRGCGFRSRGDVYSTVSGSPFGKPLEWFLMDPPVPVPMHEERALGLKNVGVSILPDAEGVHHIWDIVGRESYPNVADFVEEMRYFLSIGREAMSRKLPKNLDFSRLEHGRSRHVLLHRHAVIDNCGDLYEAIHRHGRSHSCPKDIDEHLPLERADGFPLLPEMMCAGLWWEDVVGPNTDIVGIRYMPSFSYEARPPLIETEHTLGIFAVMPITSLVVIKDDRRRGLVNRLVERISDMTDIPVDIENV